MKIATRAGLAALCCCAFALQGVAGDAAVQGTPAPASAKLGDLRKSMAKAEERFLALYNQLNRNVDQQLSCNDSAPTGSRLTRRSCATRSQTRASEELARNYLAAAADMGASQAQAGAERNEASAVAQAGTPLADSQSAAQVGTQAPDASVNTSSGEAATRRAQETREFEANLRKLMDAHPELRQRYQELLAARRQYQQAGGRL
jgi:hypothetical protein